MTTGIGNPYGYNKSLAADAAAAAADAVSDAKAAAANAATAAAHAALKATPHVPLTKAEFDALYAHIACADCRRTAINFGEPNYNGKCTHKKGGSKKKSRRLRRGKSKSKFQRRGKSVKRQRRY